MDNPELEKLITEMHTDIKWIKLYITELNRYKLLIWAALIGAILGVII